MIRITGLKLLNIISILILLSVLFLVRFPGVANAQVVINEFQISPSTNQWIELINVGSEEVDVSKWIIDDTENSNASAYTIPDGTILLPQKCISFKSSSFNWNTSSVDQVRLVSPSGVESYSYSKSPGENISIGRILDGHGDLAILSVQSRDAYNSNGENCVAETPTPVPTSTSTAAPTPMSYKATYKINDPKDAGGASINGVQIYVDGNYIHHEDKETLYFYNGHECYMGVDCSLGTHTISMRKTGYMSWEDTQNFSAGQNLEVNPILEKENTSTSTPSPAKTPTPSPIPTKTPKPTVFENMASRSASISSSSGVLGLSINNFMSASPSPTPASGKNKISILPFALIFGGFCFIALPIFSIIRNGKKSTEAI